MDTNSDWVIVGRFGRPHGIKGFVNIISFTEPRDNIFYYTDWHARIQKKWLPIKLLQTEVGNTLLLARVEGYQVREQVACLTNIDIAVSRVQLKALQPGEYYWHQLVGMKVVDQQGKLFGMVTEILPTGANDVLIVTGEKRHLIPYLPGQVVLEVNDNQRVITVDWDADF